MTLEESKQYFSKLWPNMMKDTRMLIVDYDIMRYHSLDLIRYEMFKHEDLFAKLNKEYWELRVNHHPAEYVYYMMNKGKVLNIFKCFDLDIGVNTTMQYEDRLKAMMEDPISKTTVSDIAQRFDIVFQRKGISGVLLRYTSDRNIPTCYDRLIVYDVDYILDGAVAIELIIRHKINAVMVSSIHLAIHIGTEVLNRGYTEPITFIIGVYGYNYDMTDSGKLPYFAPEIVKLTEKYHYEFGVVNPFTSLTDQFKFTHPEIGGSSNETANPV